MKRKIIFTVFLFVVFFTLVQRNSLAQDIIPSNIPQPGVTCGNPNGSGNLRKCCQSPLITPAAIHLGNPVLDSAYAVIRPIVEKNTNAMIQKQKTIMVKPCTEGVPSTPGDIENASCICLQEAPATPLSSIESTCQRIRTPAERGQCVDCAHNKSGVWTALGCFNGNLSEFITNNIMRTGIGIGGGISMLCIMFAAFQMQTSSGNAEKIKKAQELLTNCITGLMVIIFSILILKIIGVDILKLPGFTSTM